VRAGRAESELSAVFLDRDGVINRKAPEGAYVTSVAQLELLPGALDAISLLSTLGVPIVIVTNQRGLARGALSEPELDGIHAALLAQVSAAGGRIDAIYYCPHEGDCNCRKPLPGMLIEAATQFGFELQNAVMIGDGEADMLAAAAVGAQRILVGAGAPADVAADARAHDLLEAARLLTGVAEGAAG
jgi:D-glycero-D-manno-heptose 1,7-bisphosphate phosphatase